ncbi:MAG: homoserine O-succinyltransferase [Anaerococcus sp.]|nr:homoserine O-succinyltransferase [Anaerococcus sp.]
MPLAIKERLIKKEDLLKENILTINSEKLKNQNENTFKIGVVNLMPNKEETEINLLKLLSSEYQIEVDFIRTASYVSKDSDQKRLEKYYKTIDEIKDNKYNGLIITGAPVENRPYTDIAYWKELTEIFDFAKTNVRSTLFICWSAVASLEYFYNIKSTFIENKIFGIYEYKKISDSKLLEGLDDHFFIPQSRYKKIDKNNISIDELKILFENKETGVSLIESTDGRFIFNLGHLEYSKETLHNEYIRDIDRGLATKIPTNYYKNSKVNIENVDYSWKFTAKILFENWLNYYVF